MAAAFGPWGLAATGIGATASLFSGKGQANAAKEAAQIQADAENKAAQLQADAARNTLAFETQQAGQNQSNFQAAQNANYNQWLYRQGIVRPYQQSGLNAENTLGQMLGLPAIDPTMPSTPPPPSFQTVGMPGTPPTNAPQSSGPNYSPLVDALNKGQSPQAVIDQFNKSQGPASTGETYAWRSIPNAPGGGVVEIPGGAYLAPGPNGQWGYTGAPASSGTAATAGRYVLNGPPVAPTPAGNAVTLPFVQPPGTLGAYLNGAYA